MPHYITELQRAIRQLHGCESVHTKSVTVTETFQGKVLWEGSVEVFRLLNHKKTDTAYAWACLDESKRAQFITVLKITPVDTPERAVKALIASRLKAALPAAAGQFSSDTTPASSG